MRKKAPQGTSPELEMKIHGLNACRALFKARSSALIRLYVTQKTMQQLADIVRHCVDFRLAYHVVSEEELSELSGATHHEGVMMIIRRRKNPSESELKEVAQGKGLFLALEQVENPHNLGAIVRSAAHFGVKAIFLVGKKTSWQNGAFYRTAEGGAEEVLIAAVENWPKMLELKTKLGLSLYTTSGHKGVSLYQQKLPEKLLVALGAEGQGLSDVALSLGEKRLLIPGTGAVESLNVGVASAVIMGEWSRQHGP